MDPILNLTSQCIEPSVVMEGYLADLRDLYAMEADGGKTAAVKDAIGKFVRNASQRIVTMIGNLVTRLSEMIGAIGNMTAKKVQAPKELVESFNKMLDRTQKITKDGSKYVKTLEEINNSLATAAQFQRWMFGRGQEGVFQDLADAKKEFAQEVKVIADDDVLAGRSVDDYMSTLKENVGERVAFEPSKAQRVLTPMRAYWSTRMRMMKVSAHKMTAMINQNLIMTKDSNEKDRIKRTQSIFGEIYSYMMTIVTGMIKICGYLQKYITTIRKASKLDAITGDTVEGRIVERDKPMQFQKALTAGNA